MTTDWQMPRAGKNCTACAHSFEVNETFQASLYDTPAGYERRDYCGRCPAPAEPAPLATWRTRRAGPGARHAHPFDRGAVLSFFQRLQDAPTPAKVQFRFVLALLLWRKKVLRFERSLHEDSAEVWEFFCPSAEERFRVPRPELGEDELEQLSRQLEGLLAGAPGEMEGLIPDPEGSPHATE